MSIIKAWYAPILWSDDFKYRWQSHWFLRSPLERRRNVVDRVLSKAGKCMSKIITKFKGPKIVLKSGGISPSRQRTKTSGTIQQTIEKRYWQAASRGPIYWRQLQFWCLRSPLTYHSRKQTSNQKLLLVIEENVRESKEEPLWSTPSCRAQCGFSSDLGTITWIFW